ncbi:sialate O-acetylesterase [Reichenbachiella carrageenanivorans]|uniref:Sialate O-acetylesterase n=1 Tax=Reichenbachiella carrageenanivorans TaxID=2979869 RepID=A0ABY6CW37_9BACT|nr:sialate O-acetylesterase [Reichenbachiella carrageenanivorans]UXX78115.1 sialate O-acetylesterase [Reichenbachiella carrageenanivorans]
MRNSNQLILAIGVWIWIVFLPVLHTYAKTKKTVKVVFLAGQSNMAGAGNYDELDEADKARVLKAAERVSLSFNGKAIVPLAPYDNKPTEKYNFTQRFGPELFIGAVLAEKYPDDEFLLIKVSHGGTALYGAWNPEWSAEQSKEVEKGELKQNLKLYEKHLAAIDENLKQLQAEGKSYEIFGMCWMQGENDAAKEVSARSYAQNLTKLIASYRQQYEVPKMPFVLAQINSTYGRFDEGPEMVRGMMLAVAREDKYVYCIPTTTDRSWSDFPKHSDQVHYNAAGQARLGTAMGEALISLQ